MNSSRLAKRLISVSILLYAQISLASRVHYYDVSVINEAKQAIQVTCFEQDFGFNKRLLAYASLDRGESRNLRVPANRALFSGIECRDSVNHKL